MAKTRTGRLGDLVIDHNLSARFKRLRGHALTPSVIGLPSARLARFRRNDAVEAVQRSLRSLSSSSHQRTCDEDIFQM
jgi:hypothetical protein